MISNTRYIFISALFTSMIFIAESAKSMDDIEDIYSIRGPASHIYSQIEFLPILQMIQPWRRSRVEEKLSNRECGIVLNQLYVSIFHNTHKHLPSPFTSRSGQKAWNRYVLPQHYPDLLFCEAIQKLDKAEGKLRATGIVPRFIPQKRFPSRHPLAVSFQSEIFYIIADLIILAIEDYPPAQLMLAKLSSENRHLRLTPAFAYFLTSRARMGGLEDPELAPLYEAAKTELSENARNALSSLIKSGDWPQDWPLVRD